MQGQGIRDTTLHFTATFSNANHNIWCGATTPSQTDHYRDLNNKRTASRLVFNPMEPTYSPNIISAQCLSLTEHSGDKKYNPRFLENIYLLQKQMRLYYLALNKNLYLYAHTYRWGNPATPTFEGTFQGWNIIYTREDSHRSSNETPRRFNCTSNMPYWGEDVKSITRHTKPQLFNTLPLSVESYHYNKPWKEQPRSCPPPCRPMSTNA